MIDDNTYTPKTKIGKILESQPLYNIMVTDNKDFIKVMFVDFKEDDLLSNDGEISEPDFTKCFQIFTNEIHLKNELVEIKDDNISESLTQYLNLEFLKIVEEQADKNRNSKISPLDENENSQFDIDCLKFSEEIKISFPDIDDISIFLKRKILAKLYNLSNWIATTCRIGPGKFLITNSKTNDYLLKLHINIEQFRLFVFDSLEDGKIIMGRKNSFDQPGILLVLNENSIEDIVYKDGKSYVNLLYSFSANGYNPERNYFPMYKK